MSTTGIQNYLSNVFRQVYTYDTTTALFTPRLELSNIDTYSGNAISVATAAVGDAACNVYVGSNAGNPYNFIQSDSNVTAVGFGAGEGISNVSNSVYLGFRAGAGASSANAVIAIGASSIGGGLSNIFIGNGTGTVGSSNIFIGHGIAPVNVSNQIRIGISNRIVIAADLSLGWVGFGGILNPVDVSNKVDVSGNTRIEGDLGIRTTPGMYTLDVSGTFRTTRNGNFIDFSGSALRSTGGFTSLRGSIPVSNTSNVSIGANSLKKGLVMIAVSSGATHFDGRTSFVLDAAAGTVSNLASNKSATTTVNFTANNINISNTTGGLLTYDYSVTYFPMP